MISSEDDFLGQVFGSQQRGKVRTKKAGCLHYYLSDYSKKQYFKMTLVNTASLLFYLQYTSMYFNVHFVQQHQDNCILYTHTLLSILILLCCISILTLFYTGCPSNFRPRFQSSINLSLSSQIESKCLSLSVSESQLQSLSEFQSLRLSQF